MKIRVYYEDTDAGGIVYHANYIKFCERARSEMLFDSKLDVFSPSCYFVVTGINAKFIKPAVLGHTLEVKTRAKEIKKASLVLRQEIFRIAKENEVSSELIFAADITVACLDHSRPCRMSEELVSFFRSLAAGSKS